MSDDDQCVKCDGYSGGSTLCIVCERLALKKNIKKPRRKKADPLVMEMLSALKDVLLDPGTVPNDYLRDLIARVDARFRP